MRRRVHFLLNYSHERIKKWANEAQFLIQRQQKSPNTQPYKGKALEAERLRTAGLISIHICKLVFLPSFKFTERPAHTVRAALAIIIRQGLSRDD